MDPTSRTALDQALVEFFDEDRNWWPLLWLRPDREQRLSLTRTWTLAGLLGLPLGLLANVLLAVLANAMGSPPPSGWSMPLLLVALNGFALHLTLVPAWNRRARQLERLRRFRSPSA